MKRHILFLFIFISVFFSSCATFSIIKLMNSGEVEPRAFKAVIPFEYRMELIILKVKIHDETYDFILDTGAPNVLSKELSAKLGLKNISSQKAGDSQNNSGTLEFVEIPELRIGDLVFRETGAAVADLSSTPEIGCLKLDGFIGSNLMRKAIWQFDFEKKEITVTNEIKTLHMADGSTIVKFKPQITGTPVIDIDFNGVTEKNITFDTGSNGGIHVSKKTLDALLKTNPDLKMIYGTGVTQAGLFGEAKPDTTFSAVIPQIKMGGEILTNQIVEFTEKGEQTIGMDVIRNYIVTLNWFKNEIIFSPVRKSDHDTISNFGFSPLYRNEKMLVSFLYPGSPAAKAGLTLGDQIIKVNDKDYSAMGANDWCEIINHGITGRDDEEISITVKKADGSIREIRFKKEVMLAS